jgi:ATP synthase F0, C subunit
VGDKQSLSPTSRQENKKQLIIKKQKTMLTSLLLAAETAKLGAAIGAGIAAVGAGLGIGRIGGQAMDAMARQPEKIGELRSVMIIAAALVEGVAFFAAIIALLCVF